MEVTVYTRHTEGCPYIKDRYSKRCSCRKWFDYFRNGKQVRESADTRSWDTAVKLARKMEREYDDRRLGIALTPKVGTITIEGAVLAYLKKIGDPKEGRQPPTLVKPKRMTSLLIEFCDRKNLTYLSELTPLLLEEWRTSWIHFYLEDGGWVCGVQRGELKPLPSSRTKLLLAQAPSGWPFPACQEDNRTCEGFASLAPAGSPGCSRAQSNRWWYFSEPFLPVRGQWSSRSRRPTPSPRCRSLPERRKTLPHRR